MTIPSYQIHNILKDFVQQLQRRCREEADTTHRDAPAILPLARGHDRLKAVADNLTATILQRIVDTQRGQITDAAPRPPRPVRPEAPRPAAVTPAFEYLVMDPQGAKQSCRLTVEDAQVLIERFLVLDGARQTPPPLPHGTEGDES